MMPPFPSPFWFVSVCSVPCPRCGGTGTGWHADGRAIEACARCLGTGHRPQLFVRGISGPTVRCGVVLLVLIAALALR